MTIWLATILLFGSLLLFLATGLPIAFAIGGVAAIFSIAFLGPHYLLNLSYTAFGETQDFIMIAVPLFMLMGNVLETSGIADRLYHTAYIWFGRIKGGLAVGTVAICTLFAALSGVSSTATVTMGIVAIPSMLKRAYDKRIVLGSIQAGGALGILIPPSVGMLVYAVFADESVGRLFAGGLFPGLLLSTLFFIYILTRSYLQPGMAPPIPIEERGSWGEKIRSLRSIILPVILVIAVLGSIYSGIATPTEAAAIGAFGAFLCAVAYRSLKLNALKEATLRTLFLTGILMWLMIAGKSFTSVFIGIGGGDLITQFIAELPVNRWVVIIMMQLIWFVMGCFLDPIAITVLTIPFFVPIIKDLGFDGVWFGVLFIMNNETAFLTPPYGMNLFYIKAVAPKEISMRDIYSSVSPFVVIQVIGLVTCMVFPQIILWLPNILFG